MSVPDSRKVRLRLACAGAMAGAGASCCGTPADGRAQPDPLRGDVEVGVGGAVDEQRLSKHAGRRHQPRAVVEVAAAVEPLVLDDDWHVVNAVLVGQAQAPRPVVVDDEHAGHASVDVLAHQRHDQGDEDGGDGTLSGVPAMDHAEDP
jgi:hypothetical protein